MTGESVNDKAERADRIAKAVSDRMRERGHTYDTLAALTVQQDPDGEGLSVSGIAKLAQGKVSYPHRGTAAKLERALGWQHGHLERMARGEDPRPPVTGRSEDVLDESIRDMADLVDALQRSAVAAERVLANLKWARTQR